MFNLNLNCPFVESLADVTKDISHIVSPPLPLLSTKIWSLVVFGEENTNSIPSPLALFVHQSKFNLFVPLKLMVKSSCFSDSKLIFPFDEFKPSTNASGVLVIIVGLCSSVEPPYSVTCNMSAGYPYIFKRALTLLNVPFDL